MIKMLTVVSSNVSRIGYDGKSNLFVQFGDLGSVYQYANVPAEIFEEIQVAPSVGQYIARYVRNAYGAKKYPIQEAMQKFGLTETGVKLCEKNEPKP